jgi:hypothetical protein
MVAFFAIQKEEDALLAMMVIIKLIKVVIIVGPDVRVVVIQVLVIHVMMDIIYLQANVIDVIQIAKLVKALLQNASLVMMDII